MKTRARIVSGLAALAALFLAPLAEASLTRATSPAIEPREIPALTLTAAAPSEFSLFEGDELAGALDAPRARAGRFHPLAAVSLLSKDGAEAPLVSAEPSRFQKTRIGVFDFLGSRIIGVESELSLELQWGSGRFGLRTSEGIGIWLSQDPLGDVDSPNLYGFVGMRPHERTDPLGLMSGWDARVGRDDVFPNVNIESGNKLLDYTALGVVNTILNILAGVVNAGSNALYGPLRKLGWTDTDIEAFNTYLAMNPAEVAAAMRGLQAGVEGLGQLLQRVRRAKIPVLAEPRLSPSEYARLRSKTPDSAARKAVNPPGPKFDPVYGYSVTRFEADHIVPMKQIVEMPGFTRLTEVQQLEVLNEVKENLMGLGKATNASKAAKTWAEWAGHSELGPVPPEVRKAMLELESVARAALEQAIKRKLGGG